MRVIFLTHNYPRHAGDLPGAFLHPLALGLRAAGVDLRVVAPADEGRGGVSTLEGIPVHRVRYAPAAWERLAYTGRMRAALRDPRGLLALGGLWRALRRGAREEAASATGPVVVHAHWWFPSGWAAPPELPLVVTLHGSDGALLEGGALARRLGRRVLGRAAVVTAVSSRLATIVNRVTGRNVPADAIQPMPVDASAFRRSKGGGGIVTVARLTAQKRLHLLLEAAALLASQGMRPTVTVVGDGPELVRLRQLATTLGIGDQVRFPGRLATDQVAGILATADLFVLPAEREGFGLAAAEALMAGVPVVVCEDGGGLLDAVPAGGGGRHAAPAAAAIAAAMRELLGKPAAMNSAWEAGQLLRLQLAPEAVAAHALGWYRRAAKAR